jgi:hypothetical protein
MSLYDKKLPTLKDKIKQEAELAEALKAKLEKEDDKKKLVVKKKSNKK